MSIPSVHVLVSQYCFSKKTKTNKQKPGVLEEMANSRARTGRYKMILELLVV
jgi:hypothetical protein